LRLQGARRRRITFKNTGHKNKPFLMPLGRFYRLLIGKLAQQRSELTSFGQEIP
jgi:hypothetical protein